MGPCAIQLSHSWHFIMALEEQRGDPDDLQSPRSQRKHTLILPAVNLLKKGELSMYFRIALNKN